MLGPFRCRMRGAVLQGSHAGGGLNVKVNTRLMADKAHADALEPERNSCWPSLCRRLTGSIRLYQMSEGEKKMAQILKARPWWPP